MKLSGPFGAIDADALARIRALLVDVEPLIERTAYDDSLDSGALHVAFETGVDAPGRFDVRWSRLGNYSFHYAEPGLDFRFDRHPNPHSATAHVPLPPDATATEPSCITVAQPEIVALAGWNAGGRCRRPGRAR